MKLILVALILRRRSYLMRSLFLSLKPSIMYSISPGVCLMMNDLRVLTRLLGGKC